MRSVLISVWALVSLGLAATPADAAGVIEGVVRLTAEPPPAKTVAVDKDSSVCGKTKEVRPVEVGPGGGVKDVVVQLAGVPGAVEPGTGLLDQVHCEFVPRVQVLPKGSKLNITSSDNVLHNAHAFWEDGSTAFNVAVPIRGMKIPQTLAKTGVLSFRCDAGHTWMSAWVVVVDHPYYALTDAEGRYRIENVPAGRHRIATWHPELGERAVEVEVEEGATATVTIEY